MATTSFYIIAVLSILLLIVIFKSCASIPEIVTVVKHDTTLQVIHTPQQQIHDTVKSGIQYIPKFVYDTIIRDGQKIAITPEKYCLENLEFTANSDTLLTSKGDTANIIFRYPAMIFDLSMKFKADSIKTITTTITKTIQQSPLSVGLQIGAGVVRPIDGNFSVGVYAGFGISYKF